MAKKKEAPVRKRAPFDGNMEALMTAEERVKKAKADRKANKAESAE